MSENARVRVLSGVAAGLTVTALFAATFTAPANAEPIDTASKFRVSPSVESSRIVTGRYLVETAGTPTIRGGNKTATKTALATAKSAAAASGAEVKGSFSSLWTGLSVTATDAQIKKLAKSPAVTAIFPVLKVALPKTQTSSADASAALSEIGVLGAGYTGDGIKVGVIDTGIDYNNADLGGSGVSGSNADFGSSAPRVKYGSDFVGDDYDADYPATSDPQPDAYPDDCNGHGTHVAGIIGANGSGSGDTVMGVAPKVTLGAYRIFGCDGSSATDVILSAMTAAQADGMDVVNMSLGSDFASWPSYPESIAATNMTNAGIVMVVSAGNSGDTGLFSAGAPASGKGVITVASYESATIRTKSIGVGTDKIAYVPIEKSGTVPADGTTLSVRNASSITACKALSAVPGGTALLIKRGTCDISVKFQRAVTAGAAAVVLYDSESGINSFSTHPLTFAIPGVSISGSQGSSLYAKIKKSGPQTMTWLALQSGIANPGGGKISKFSSAGLAADLSLVPTISAPGGKIYSTMPIEQGGHGTMSGTSMATPFVAGSVALLLEAKPTFKGHPASVAQLLYNTAAPVTRSTESGVTSRPAAVFRQGSGVVQVANAIAAGVTASPAVLPLGEGTSDTVTVTLKNTTAGPLTYKPSRVSGASAAASTGSGTRVGTTTPKYGFGEVGFTATPKTVTVPAGGTATVKIKLTAPSKVLKGKVGMLYGGWVKFTTTGAGNTVSIPFAGLRGDYQKVKLLNKFKLVDDKSKKWSLPRLGVNFQDGTDASGVYFYSSTKSNYYEYDLSMYTPVVLYHLDYPASDLRLKVINTKTKKSYYAIIDWNAATPEKATHWGLLPRDAGPEWVAFSGAYLNTSGGVSWVDDGNYQLQLKVLKPLGNSAKSSDWETYTSPKFYIFQ